MNVYHWPDLTTRRRDSSSDARAEPTATQYRSRHRENTTSLCDPLDNWNINVKKIKSISLKNFYLRYINLNPVTALYLSISWRWRLWYLLSNSLLGSNSYEYYFLTRDNHQFRTVGQCVSSEGARRPPGETEAAAFPKHQHPTEISATLSIKQLITARSIETTQNPSIWHQYLSLLGLIGSKFSDTNQSSWQGTDCRAGIGQGRRW